MYTQPHMPGVANQSETKSHIIHTGTHEHHPVSSSLKHIPLLS